MLKRHTGLTLIEVLIASSLLLILLGLITTGLQSSGDVVSVIASKGELIEETRYAGQIMADELARALYVYRPGVSVTLPDNYATKRPVGTGTLNQWTVKSNVTENAGPPITETVDLTVAPIVAFIQAPLDSTTACNLTGTVTGCLTFVAYYPILRSTLVANAATADKPRSYADDANTWVIMEYRKILNYKTISNSSVESQNINNDTFKALDLTGGTTTLLADYIQPGNGFTIKFSQCSSGSSLSATGQMTLVSCDSSDSSYDYWESVRNGQIKLIAQTKKGIKTTTIPELTFAIAPRSATPSQAN
jgi:hypothetical protein